MNDKRIVTEIDGSFLIEKITFEEWCNHLTVSSYFIDNEVMQQIEYFYPTTVFSS